MPSTRDVISALYGAYRLARLDPGGMRYFDVSEQGFWRSFFAAVIVAPFYGLLLYLNYDPTVPTVHPARYVLIQVISYIILWVAFPLVMVSVARLLNRERQYAGYIIAYNWAAVLQNALHLPVAYMIATGAVSGQAGNGLEMIVITIVVAYTGYITFTALEVSAMAAAGVVALDFVMSIFINGIALAVI